LINDNEDELLLILPGFVRFVELPLLNSADLPEIFKSEDELRIMEEPHN